MKLNELVKNSRGLIPAPEESEDAFVLRCSQAKKKGSVPDSKLAKDLFDIEPDWVQIRFSDRGLRLWEGGCTWILESGVILQVRKALERKARYLGYSREEIVAHELVHVVRGGFQEPIFEEILAYQTSPSFFRRFFGPIFRSSKESLIFVAALLTTFLATLFDTFQILFYSGVLALVGGGIFRLIRSQRIFSKARKKLSEVVGHEKALPVMIRLTDREIFRFSKMEKEQIVSYAVKMSRAQIRWQQIRHAYFVKSTEV